MYPFITQIWTLFSMDACNPRYNSAIPRIFTKLPFSCYLPM